MKKIGIFEFFRELPHFGKYRTGKFSKEAFITNREIFQISSERIKGEIARSEKKDFEVITGKRFADFQFMRQKVGKLTGAFCLLVLGRKS